MSSQIIDGKKYDTETATEIGSTRRHNGSNWDNRWTLLYKTQKGAFFQVYYSQWQGEPWEHISPLDETEAKKLYESLHKPDFSYKETFGVEPEEA